MPEKLKQEKRVRSSLLLRSNTLLKCRTGVESMPSEATTPTSTRLCKTFASGSLTALVAKSSRAPKTFLHFGSLLRLTPLTRNSNSSPARNYSHSSSTDPTPPPELGLVEVGEIEEKKGWKGKGKKGRWNGVEIHWE